MEFSGTSGQGHGREPEPADSVRLRGPHRTVENTSASVLAPSSLEEPFGQTTTDDSGRIVEEGKNEPKALPGVETIEEEDGKLAVAAGGFCPESGAAPQLTAARQETSQPRESPGVVQATDHCKETSHEHSAVVTAALTPSTFAGYSAQDVKCHKEGNQRAGVTYSQHGVQHGVQDKCSEASQQKYKSQNEALNVRYLELNSDTGTSSNITLSRQSEPTHPATQSDAPVPQSKFVAKNQHSCHNCEPPTDHRYECSENGLLVRNGAPPVPAEGPDFDRSDAGCQARQTVATHTPNLWHAPCAQLVLSDGARFANNLPPVQEGSVEEASGSNDEEEAECDTSAPQAQLVWGDNALHVNDLPPVAETGRGVLNRDENEEAGEGAEDGDDEDQHEDDGDDNGEVVDLRAGQARRRCHRCRSSRIEVLLQPCCHEFACFQCFLRLCRRAGGSFPCFVCEQHFVDIVVPYIVMARYARRCRTYFQRCCGG